jgi:hypothetical protein
MLVAQLPWRSRFSDADPNRSARSEAALGTIAQFGQAQRMRLRIKPNRTNKIASCSSQFSQRSTHTIGLLPLKLNFSPGGRHLEARIQMISSKTSWRSEATYCTAAPMISL